MDLRKYIIDDTFLNELLEFKENPELISSVVNKLRDVNVIYTDVRQIISMEVWDKLIVDTYGRPYNIQNQEDGRQNGISIMINVPDNYRDDYPKDNSSDLFGYGINFETWLNTPSELYVDSYWEQHFYPDEQILAQDLHKRGILPTGIYYIEIIW